MYANDIPNSDPLKELIEKIQGKGWELPKLPPDELLLFRNEAKKCMEEGSDPKWAYWRLFVAAFDGAEARPSNEPILLSKPKGGKDVTAEELLHLFSYYIIMPPLAEGFTEGFFIAMFKGWVHHLQRVNKVSQKAFKSGIAIY